MSELIVHFMDDSHIQIVFYKDAGPLWWKPTVHGLMVKETSKGNRIVYPWKNIKAYEINPGYVGPIENEDDLD